MEKVSNTLNTFVNLVYSQQHTEAKKTNPNSWYPVSNNNVIKARNFRIIIQSQKKKKDGVQGMKQDNGAKNSSGDFGEPTSTICSAVKLCGDTESIPGVGFIASNFTYVKMR